MEQFIGILRAQLVLCQELLRLSIQYKEHLLDSQARQSSPAIAKQEEYISKITALENKKNVLLLANGVSTVQQFIVLQTASPKLDILQILNERLGTILGKLKERNQRNAGLLQKKMEFIDYSINVMTQTTMDNTYARKGNTPPGTVVSQKKIFDQTI